MKPKNPNEKKPKAHKAGASINEIFEAILIETIMTMAKSQAIAFRRFHELKDK